MSAETKPIGFMGVGAIGRPIAERLLDRTPLVICDPSEAACDHFAGKAEFAAAPSELAGRVETIFACLPSHQSYRAAVLASDGILCGTRLKTFVHIGTTGPELARKMSNACAARQVAMIDAPVTGGPPRARTGDLGVMASGPRDAFDAVEPLIRSYASTVTYLGSEPGQAQLMKLINNMLSAANLAIASEVLLLGAKAGLDPVEMLAVVNAGTGQNSATLTKIPNHLLTRRFDYGGRLEVVYKDLAALVDQAEMLRCNLPLSRIIADTYLTAIHEDGPNADMTEVVRHMEREIGTTLGADPNAVADP